MSDPVVAAPQIDPTRPDVAARSVVPARIVVPARMRTVSLWGCAAFALASLPERLFDPRWLLVFIAPAILLHVLIATTRVRSLAAFAIALATFACGFAAALAWAAPLTRVTALGCTLIPPLAFLAARRRGSDVSRALFMAFCVFLVGAILGRPTALHGVAFLSLGIATLYFDGVASRTGGRLAWHSPLGGFATHSRRVLSLLALGIIAASACFQILRLLPSPPIDAPERRERSEGTAESAFVGLSSTFDFERSANGLLDLRADEILRVQPVDTAVVAADLYLRYAHFDVSGLDRWRTRRERLARFEGDHAVIRPALPATARREIRITLVEPPDERLFVAPGTFAIAGLDGIRGDPRRDSFRLETAPLPGTTYTVGYQDFRARAQSAMTEPAHDGLTALARELGPWIPKFVAILRDAAVEREIDPLRMARAIAGVLAHRCRYSLAGPVGPHPHSLLNFLDGDRKGFCMHFASATAICLRLAGVPCRIGVGLHGGRALRSDPRTRSFGSRDAHAWVEIPFEGYGWVVFDPTPAAEMLAARERAAGDEIDFAAGDADESVDGDTVLSAIDLLSRPLQHPIAWLVIVGLLLAAAWHGRTGPSRAEVRRLPRETLSARRQLDALLAELRRCGLARPFGTTLERFAAQIDADGLDRRTVQVAFDAYQEVRFGGQPYDEPRQRRLEDAVAEARRCAAAISAR